MAAQRHNGFLDTADESQSEGSGYDSEAAEQSKANRSSKRRKLSHDRTPDYDSDIDDHADQDATDDEPSTKDTDDILPDVARNITSQPADADSESIPAQAQDKHKRKHQPKSGVVYLSRIPPFMKPTTVRHYLEPHGAINRIFLTPEDPTSHTARVRRGGNKKRSFVDGWVEFVHKRDAKYVAETLNANIIGGKKGGYYHDDVWNIKYLRGFKWGDLTEQIKNENAERAARLRMEIAQTTRENKRFVQSVEKAKMLERMESKRMKRVGGGDVGEVSLARTDTRDSVADRQAQSGKKEGGRAKLKKDRPVMDTKKVLDMVL